MFCLRSAEAFLRSKSVLLAAVFASVSSIAFSQDSFMVHFTPSGGGAGIINRGDFNNDGIPDIITGNNGGGYGVSVNLGIGDGRFRNPLNSAPGVGTPVRGGVTYREAHLAMEMIADGTIKDGKTIAADMRLQAGRVRGSRWSGH